jgi:hypothetical protein
MPGGAMRDDGGTASGGPSAQARDGVTQLNADNAASRVPSERLPTPAAAAIAAGMVAVAAGVVLLGRRRTRSPA